MQWIVDLLDKLTSFIPRLVFIEPNEGGLRITLGSRVKELTPGWYIWCPLFQEVIKLEVVSQVVDLRAQSVETKDGHHVIVSGALQYKVTDVKKAILDVQDWDKSVQTLALGVIAEYIQQHSLQECRDLENIKSEVRKKIVEASGWGLKIQQVYITDFTEAKSIRIITESSRGPMIVDEYE